MKKHTFLLLLFVSYFTTNAQEITTYYLIRHAEKDRTDATNRNPNLIEDGLKRAENWAAYFEDIPLDAIYSTEYNRTIETASPTAIRKGLQVLFYNPSNMYNETFKKETKGKTVLVVGHSNTTPAFVNIILDENKYDDLYDNDNASLFKVTVNNFTKETTSEVKKIELP